MSLFIQQTKYSKPATCGGCSLAEAGVGFTLTRSAPVGAPLIVTDCVGLHDVRTGHPLNIQSDAGSVLDRAFRLAGLSPESFALGSLVACRPPSFLANQAYEFTSIEHCSTRHLAPYVQEYRPKCIVALGSVAARSLTGLSGEKLTIDLIRGYALPGIGVAKGIPVIPAPSPSFIQAGNWHELSFLISDLKYASVCDRIPDDPEVDAYLLHADHRALGLILQKLRSYPDSILSYDFEFLPAAAQAKKKFTTDAHITQVNLTLWHKDSEYLTMVADWNPDTKDVLIEIFQTDNIKVSFNGWHADECVAEYNGFEIKGREQHDVKVMVDFLYPDLDPAQNYSTRSEDDDFLTTPSSGIALQVAASLAQFPAPWKHLSGMDPHFYGARDSHATVVTFFWACDELVRRNLYGSYEFFIRSRRPTLKGAEGHGYPMRAEGLQDLQDFIKGEIVKANSSIQDLVPPDLKPYKERKPRSDKELESLVAEHGVNLFKQSGIWSEEKCECGEKSIGQPAPGCPDCAGTGTEITGTKACPGCRKHTIEPDGSKTNWTCTSCGWVDTRPMEFGRKDTKKSVKLVHDEDLATGKYVCKTCKGAREVANEKPCGCSKRITYDPMCPHCKGSGTVREKVDRWCIRQAFNPNSHDQLKRYAVAKNHNIPKSGLGREGLAQLARQTGDAVYRTVHSIKVLESIAGATTPLTSIASITDAEVIRVHPQFVFTADGSIASRSPSLKPPDLNHRYPGLAEAWSRCIAPNPTDTTQLVSVSLGPGTDIELFALEARDEGLMSIASMSTWWLLNTAKIKPLGNNSVDWSSTQYAMARQIWKAFLSHLPERTVYERNRNLFDSPEVPGWLLRTLEFHFPRSVEYRTMIANQAHKQGILRSRFGFERQFYNVLRSRDSGYVAGLDYHDAVSFNWRNHQACSLRLLGLKAPGDWQLVNVLDDSLVYEVSSGSQADFDWTINTGLTKPDGSPWMPRLSCELVKGKE